MKYLRRSSEDEMIALFLEAELESSRFHRDLRAVIDATGAASSIITAPVLTDRRENRLRKAILTEFRGYSTRTGIFDGFPRHLEWHRVSLSRDEYRHLRYIDYSYWNELTGGTRLPADASVRIRRDVRPFGVSNRAFLDGEQQVRSGTVFRDIIVVAEDLQSYRVILEGHSRITAYALAGDFGPARIEALLGTSRGIRRWGCY